MPHYSPSVILVWRIAAGEAHAGNATEIEPSHLLLGLCKLCDLDFEELFAGQSDVDHGARRDIEDEAEELRGLFQQAGLDQTRFRRRLRALVAKSGPSPADDDVMHRSRESRRVFRRAEEMVQTTGGSGVVQTRHLLRALLEIADAPWAGLLAEMGTDDPLRQILGAAPAAKKAASRIVPVEANDGEEAVESPPTRRTPLLDRFGRDLDGACARRQAGPCYWATRRDAQPGARAHAEAQEQPHPCRRGRRGQDLHRRGPCPADRRLRARLRPSRTSE